MPEPLYLSSLESRLFEPVRECRLGEVLVLDTGKAAVVADIAPPVVGQDFGRADVDRVVLVARHEGETVDPVSSFPLFVFIAVPADESAALTSPVRADELTVLAWGELYRTREDAERHAFD